MAALTLARAGVSCRLLERSRLGVDKVCGEFLSPEAVALLDGLDFPWARAQASSIRLLRLDHRGRSVTLPLPFEGRGVARAFLDSWLLETARQAGAEVLLGTQVREVVRSGDNFRLLAEEGSFLAGTLVLATGKHSLGPFHPRRPAPGPAVVGWKMNFHKLGQGLVGALQQTLGLFFFDGGYGGISRVGDDVVTASLLLQPVALQQHRQGPLAVLEALKSEVSLVAQLLGESEPVWDRPKTVANLPYGHCDTSAEPGLFPVGNQFAVLPSFTGTGMSFAMASGTLAARHILLSPPTTAPWHYAEEARAMARKVLRLALPLHRLLQRPAFARMAMTALGLAPQLMPVVARRTRVPQPHPAKDVA